MNELKRICILLLALASIIFLPYAGAALHHNGIFPPDFFDYPPLKAMAKEPFNPIIFWAIAIVGIITAALYLFPRFFGFRKLPKEKIIVSEKTNLPVWFWIGLIMWGLSLGFLWAKVPEPAWFINWSYIPLFWGFTLMVDGWVFIRTGGKSLIATAPAEMFAMGIAAMGGWMLFEYLNLFVDDNWFYPAGAIIPDNEFLIYAIIGSSGLMPPIFELYHLFRTFPGLRDRYSSGPKVPLPRWLLICVAIGAVVSLFAVGYMPESLFGLLWISPLLIFATLLELMKIWTPFSSMRTGNWTPAMLYALAYLVYGFLLEFWNFFSSTHPDSGTAICFNPAHWVYSLSYVNTPHIFEMPLLGFLGYLPFGIYCAVWWFVFAKMMGIQSHFVQGGMPGHYVKEE